MFSLLQANPPRSYSVFGNSDIRLLHDCKQLQTCKPSTGPAILTGRQIHNNAVSAKGQQGIH